MNKRFAALWLPFLLTDWYSRRQSACKDVPLVSAIPIHGKMCITAVNAVAKQQGIGVSMVLADAKAAIPNLVMFEDTPSRSDNLLKKIGLWAIRFTPIVGLDGLGGLVFDITGCAHLWGGEANYLTTINKQLARKGYTSKLAIADTVGAAWAVARYGEEETILSEDNKQTVLFSLPPEALRLEHSTIERLYKLGFKTIGSFASFPLSILRRRFGEELVKRLDQLLGKKEESIYPLRPILPYVERLPCLEPIRTAKGIELAIQQLLEMLCNRLDKEGKGIRKAKLTSYRVDGKIITIEIGTNSASANRKHLFELFELKIQTIAPALGIELFFLEALKVEDCLPHQECLWAAEEHMVYQNVSELLDRFKGRDGHCHIRRYLPDEHHWPERAIRSTSSLLQKTAGIWPENRPRPTRLLHPPQPVEVTAPIPDYPPMLFRFQGEVHVIKRADGPERIEREWWLEKGEHRDYYYVEDEEGKRYWLFRLGHYVGDRSPNWFLHGFFA